MHKTTEHTMKQGSIEWHIARLGKVTASHAKDVVTPGGKPTANKARETYRNELLAERMLGRAADHFTTDAMKRGTELEPAARTWYKLETGNRVRQVGFVTRDDIAGCGCSPDGICDDRMIEIKIPVAHNLIGLILGDAPQEDYNLQIQFQMWICGVALCDLVLFSDTDGIPSRIYTVAKDDKMHASFDTHIPSFIAELAACEARIIAMGGVKISPAEAYKPVDAGVPDGFGPPPVGSILAR